MLPIKKILCPTDFSEPSYKALKTAIEFAKHFSAKLYLVNITHTIPILPQSPSFSATGAPVTFDIIRYRKELEVSAKRSLKDVYKKFVKKNLNVTLIVGYGDAADEILKIASEEKIDLIVIATHGRTGWRHLLFGSVAEKIVRLSKQSVLTVRAKQMHDNLSVQ